MPAPPGAPLAERHDHVFLGTSISGGTGRAVVTATGMATELGRIATLLETAEDGRPAAAPARAGRSDVDRRDD